MSLVLSWLGMLALIQRIELLGGVVVLAVLVGFLWLLLHILRQQGRLLLRIEAVESLLGQAGLPAQGADAIRDLVASATGLPVLRTVPLTAAASQRNGHGATAALRPPTGLKIGDAAPDFSLPDLSGNLVHLSDFRGQETLVLFWRPSCGFCQRMLPDLQAWEARSSKETPRLLVVSTESVQDNQAMGLRSPVVLDQAGMSVGSKFGASGTPMAVLVDAEGRIASELVAGAPAVLALARRRQEKATLTR